MKRLLFFTCYTFIFILCLSSQEVSYELSPDLIMKIELGNPKIYKEGDNIYLNVMLLNKSNNVQSTYIAEDKRHSFDFSIVTMKNQEIEYKKEYVTYFYRVQNIYMSKISLMEKEGYLYKILLNDYYDLNMTGQFYVTGYYYPNLKVNNNRDNAISSNQLVINIRDRNFDDRYFVNTVEIDDSNGSPVETLKKIPPDDVIDYMLTARMQRNWDRYFLYMNMDELIKTNNIFGRDFGKKNLEQQRELIKNYKEYLKKDNINDINFLPHKFDIVKTTYSQSEAKVEVKVQFKTLDYIEERYYTFSLHKKGEHWFVYSYEVMEMGVK